MVTVSEQRNPDTLKAVKCFEAFGAPEQERLTSLTDAKGSVRFLTGGRRRIWGRSVTDVTYDASGQVATVSYPNARSTTYQYDTRARMTAATTAGFPGTTNVLGLSYTYDGLDNITTLQNVNGFSLRMCATASSVCSGGYDALNRLVSVIAPSRWGTAAFDYDVLGNRTYKTSDQPVSTTINYTYDAANRLATASGGPATSFGWDAAGNLSSYTGAKSMTFGWDAAGRLASSSDGASYAYDGLGRRVAKTAGGVTTAYHYDAAGQVIAETTSTGQKKSYVYLAGKIVAATGCLTPGVPTCNEVQWYHTDALGSVLAYTDASGNVLERMEYGPWGESWSVSDPSRAGDRQYDGRVYDQGTGFHDYGARMYWPEIGRFVSADTYAGTVANPASLNRYSYVLNEPYRYTDSSGHCPWCVAGAVIGGVVGAGGGVWYAIDHGYSWKSGKFWASVGVGAAGGALVGGTMGFVGSALAGGGGATAATTALGAEGVAAPQVIQEIESAAPEGENIALGLSEHLDAFAQQAGGSTWKQWAAADPGNWKSAFMDVMGNVKNKVSFNLTGIDSPWAAVSRAAAGRGGATDWELSKIYQNPGWWDRITFFSEGQEVANPFAK